VRQAQEEIKQNVRDINDLVLISRDSRFARDSANSEFLRTRQQCNENRQFRSAILESKKAKQAAILARQHLDTASEERAAKPQPSMSSQPSVIRNKMNKAAREKREERFRQVSAVFEEIRDKFGTTDPDTIAQLFRERRETTAALEKQIQDLKVACSALERRTQQLKSSMEEAEYASSKGVGGGRLLSEGREILEERRTQLVQAQREVAATEAHRKHLSAGVSHLGDIMAIARREDEQLPAAPDAIVAWINEKAKIIQARLADEDVEFLPLVNKVVFAQMYAAAERALLGDETEGKPGRAGKKTDQARKQKGADYQTRVLDRASVKQQAAKALQAAQAAPKKSK
jgi:hypothetical protein